MLASSNNSSDPTHLSYRLSDACTPLPHPTSHYPDSHSPAATAIHQFARNFDCNVCMHVCRDPVVTICGHLFCWPCLYYLLSLQSASKACPVCQADVQDKIVPLYGCGLLTDSLPSDGIHIPCRPSAIAPIKCTNTSSHQNEHWGICASLLRRFGSTSLPPQDSGFLGRYANRAASLLMRRRRFNNEKEFVLHWVFITVASATITFFLACT